MQNMLKQNMLLLKSCLNVRTCVVSSLSKCLETVSSLTLHKLVHSWTIDMGLRISLGFTAITLEINHNNGHSASFDIC